MTPTTDVAATLAVLDRLVAFDTVSTRSNLALVDWAAETLAAAGARLVRVPDDTGEKAGLIASFGPRVAGGTVLSGHTDVVPTEGQHWTSDPFRLTRRGERVFGRGATDMKGFLAAAIAGLTAAPLGDLACPVHLVLSYDEEIGCLGVPRLVDALVAAEPLPAWALVGEPTEMAIVTAHKSCNLSETIFHGHEAHSSQSHLGVSANVAAARFIAYLAERFDEMAASAAGESQLVPPFPTFNAGVVHGGTAHNIIPGRAKIVWEFRGMPGDDADAMASAFLAYIDETLLPSLSGGGLLARSETIAIARVPALDPATNREARAALMALGPYEGDEGVAFATEAGSFQAAGIPTVVCGPGTITVAHQPDEWVAVDELARATALVDRVVAAARV